MQETNEQAVARWLAAAKRAAQQGNSATAITYRNMAWLIEHQASWLPQVVASAEQQVRDHLAKLATASEWEDIL